MLLAPFIVAPFIFYSLSTIINKLLSYAIMGAIYCSFNVRRDYVKDVWLLSHYSPPGGRTSVSL